MTHAAALPYADPIEAARALLPAWVPWAGLAWLPVAYLASAAVALVAAWAARLVAGDAAAPGLHWTERARRVTSQRVAIILTATLVLILADLLATVAFDASVWRVPPGPLKWGLSIAALAGALAPRRRLQRSLGLPASAFLLARDVLVYVVVLSPALSIGAITACLLPIGRGAGPCLVVGAGGMVCAAVALFGGNVIAGRALGLVRPASARLTAIVDEAARRARTRTRPVLEVRWTVANAFAFPQVEKVGFTEAATRVLDDDELCAVAVHELAHLDEPRGVRVLRAAAGLALASGLPLTAAAVGFRGAIGAVAVVPFFLLWTLLRRMARRMEERADAAAARGAEGDAVAAEAASYARALERLYEANLVPAVTRARGVHPHLYDRLVSAGAAPTYPRPAPPRPAFVASLAVAGVAALALEVVFFVAFELVDATHEVAMNGGGWEAIAALAEERRAAGDREQALTFARAAFALAGRPEADDDRARGRAGLELARVLADDGQCREARERLTAAEPAVAGETLKRRKEALAQARTAVAACDERAFELAILRDPDDDAPVVAYGEWLREQKDPRADVIAEDVARRAARRAADAKILASAHADWVAELARDLHEEVPATAKRLLLPVARPLVVAGATLAPARELAAHRDDWLGALADSRYLSHDEWRLGFLSSVVLTGDAAHTTRLLDALVKLPSGRFLREVTFFAEGVYCAEVSHIAKSPPPALRALALRRKGDLGRGPSRASRCDLAELYPKVPHLRALDVTVPASGEDFGAIDLPELTSFTVVGEGELERTEVAAFAQARWPKLVRLSLVFERDLDPEEPSEPGFEAATLADVAPLLDAQRAPALRWLAFDQVRFADALPEVLARSSILPQLTVLSLRGGMTDAGARELLAHAGAFAHLRALLLGGNRITPAVGARLRSVLPNVVTGR